ncbi:hypothetical protein V6R21_04430 [Limibacter armeniacum]|uniref:hypothetical protein n=1 Tax=Limibacter armeniacum TaxID=466084 RepID=UPI002FE5211A
MRFFLLLAFLGIFSSNVIAQDCTTRYEPPFCGSVTFEAPAFLKSTFLGANTYTWTLEQRDLADTVSTTFSNVSHSLGNESAVTINGEDYAGKQLRIKVSRGGFESQWYQNFYIFPKLVSYCDNTISSSVGLGFASGTDACRGNYISITAASSNGLDIGKKYNIIGYGRKNENWYEATVDAGTGVVTNEMVFSVYNAVVQYNSDGFSLISEDTISNERVGNLQIDSSNKNRIFIYEKSINGQEIYAGYDSGQLYIQIFPFSETGESYKEVFQNSAMLEAAVKNNRCSDPVPLTFPALSKDPLSYNADVTTLTANTYGGQVSFSITPEGGYFANPSYDLTTTADSVDIIEEEGSFTVSFNAPNPESTGNCATSISKTVTLHGCEGDSINITLTAQNPTCIVPETLENIVLSSTDATGTASIGITIPDSMSTDTYSYEMSLTRVGETSGCTVPSNSLTSSPPFLFEDLVPGTYNISLTVNYGADSSYTNIFDDAFTVVAPTSNITIGSADIVSQNEVYYGSKGGFTFNNLLENVRYEFVADGGIAIDFTGKSISNLEPQTYTSVIIKEYAGYCNSIVTRTFSANDITINSVSEISFSAFNAPELTLHSPEDIHPLGSVELSVEGGSDSLLYLVCLSKSADGSWNKLPVNNHYSLVNASENLKEISFTGFPTGQDIYVSAFDIGGLNLWGQKEADGTYNINLSDGQLDSLVDGSLAVGYAKAYSSSFKFTNPPAISSDSGDGESFDNGSGVAGTNQALPIICNGGSVSVSSMLSIPDGRILSSSVVSNFRWCLLSSGTALSEAAYTGNVTLNTDNTKLILEPISGITAETYSLYLTEDITKYDDGYTGYVIKEVEVKEPSKITVTNEIVSSYGTSFNVSRHNGQDGRIKVTVTGGLPDYKITLSNTDTTTFSTDHIFGELNANTYQVSALTDNLGCTTIYGNASVSLNAPSPLAVTATPFDYGLGYEISTNGGNNGSITIEITGGIPDYKAALYKLEDTGYSLHRDFTDVTGTSHSLLNLNAGTYRVVVKDKYYESPIEDDLTSISDGASTTGDIVISDIIVLEEPAPLVLKIDSLKNWARIPGDTLHVQSAIGTKAETGRAYYTISGGIPAQIGGNYKYTLKYQPGEVLLGIRLLFHLPQVLHILFRDTLTYFLQAL